MKEAKLEPLTPAELDELERLEKEASPGEWEAVFVPQADLEQDWVIQSTTALRWYAEVIQEPDALLIASARNALPRLIAMAREAVRLENELKTEKLVNDVLVALEKERAEA